MADEKYSVEFEYTTKGASQATGDLDKLIDKVDQLSKEGQVTEKGQEELSKSILDVQKAAGTGAKSTKSASDATKSLGESSQKASKDIESLEEATISLRYASYDIGRTFLGISAGITAAGVGVAAAFASQERAFSNVIRTAESDVGDLEQTLRDLSTAIPVSFNDLAEIATLGNQLGVAAGDIEAFTQTIATFSAATGIGFDASAEAFGKLGNLLGVVADDYDRLGSAITYVGRTTAASESQIIAIAREIAPAAAAAGFAADEVVGLSGALGSLAVPPERSRSTILQFFETLNKAVATGGQDLNDFAQVVGVTASELESMVRSGRGESILSQFVDRAATADTVELTQALQNLGLAGLRTNPTIRALAQNTELLHTSIAGGRNAWQENIELQRQMDIINQTLSATWDRFLNAALNAAAGLGAEVAPAIKDVLEGLTDLLVGFSEFAESDIGSTIIRMAATLAIASASFLALRGVIALATGSVLAMKFAMSQGIGVGLLSGLKGLAGAMYSVAGGSNTAAVGVSRLRVAVRGLMIATALGGVLMYVSEWLFNTSGAAIQLGNTMMAVADAVATAIRKITSYMGPLVQLGGILGAEAATGWARDMGNDLATWGKSLAEANKEAEHIADYIPEIADYSEDAAGFMGDFGDAAGGAADNVQDLQEELVSVLDYASDLRGVFDRAFEIRFSVSQAEDATALLLMDIEKHFADAEARVKSIRAEIRGLKADIGLTEADLSRQQYFLGIALEYGDTQRAEQIQARIAKLQAELAEKSLDLTEKNEDLSVAVDETSRSTEGNSRQAIQNRKTLEDLVKSYSDQLDALARSGASQDELRRKSEELRVDFAKQARQLGFNQSALRKYDAAMADLTTIIRQVPRNVSAQLEIRGLGPAAAALKEFRVLADAAARAAANIGTGSLPSGGPGTGPGLPFSPPAKSFDPIIVPFDYDFDDPQAVIDLLNSRIAMGAESVESASERLGISVADGTARGLLSKREQIAGTQLETILYGAPQAEKGGSEIGEKTGTSLNFSMGRIATRLIPTSIVRALAGAQPGANSTAGTIGDSTGRSFSNRTATSVRGLISGGLHGALLSGQQRANQGGQTVGAGVGSNLTSRANLSVRSLLPNGLHSSLLASRGRANQGGQSVGDGIGSNVNARASSSVRSSLGNRLRDSVLSARGRVNSGASSIGNTAGTNFSTSAAGGVRSSFGWRTTDAMNSSRWTIGQQAASLGRSIASSLRSGVSIALTSLLGTGQARQFIRGLTGFYDGGYTGSGGKYEPAGIVHRGEYVIPKRDVNQATGLPNSDALGRLMQGQRGYATGGYVRGGATSTGITTVRLSAMDHQMIANALHQNIVVNGQVLGRTTSEEYAHSTAVGAF